MGRRDNSIPFPPLCVCLQERRLPVYRIFILTVGQLRQKNKTKQTVFLQGKKQAVCLVMTINCLYENNRVIYTPRQLVICRYVLEKCSRASVFLQKRCHASVVLQKCFHNTGFSLDTFSGLCFPVEALLCHSFFQKCSHASLFLQKLFCSSFFWSRNDHMPLILLQKHSHFSVFLLKISHASVIPLVDLS